MVVCKKQNQTFCKNCECFCSSSDRVPVFNCKKEFLKDLVDCLKEEEDEKDDLDGFIIYESSPEESDYNEEDSDYSD